MRRISTLVLMLFPVLSTSAFAQGVKEDRNLFLPGSQQGSVNLESATRCDNCHGAYNQAVEPAHNWRGSMMAQAARDPLWLATMVVALQDSKAKLGNYNAGDLCIRCHSPIGWLGGRSEPTNISALTGSDFEGVSCDLCHKMVDPITARAQADVPAETTNLGITEAQKTLQADLSLLPTMALFDGSPFFDVSARLPVHYGGGTLPGYIESSAAQFFVDPSTPKRGPRSDADPKHQWYYSRYHKSANFCATCHDVSNPVVGNLLEGAGVPERQAGATYGHVERTWSEFALSAYGRGGAAPAAKLGISWAAKCQDCHMRDVTGVAANKRGILNRTDLALHDMTGGNTWMLGILASADASGPAYDPYNYAILSGTKYPGAKVDLAGVQTFGAALVDGKGRALQQIKMAADVELVGESADTLTLRVVNNTGHKLLSGYPEGRRIWLNVVFMDAVGVLAEVNPYTPLTITRDAAGNAKYVSGGTLLRTNPELVWEAHMSSALTSEPETFHFVLATDRHKDNRIPPRGFDIASAASRMTTPRWDGQDAANYFTAAEYAGGYDEVTIAKPAGAIRWSATLFYQTTSKEYVEFLRNEINGTNGTLTEPGAYVVQTDPFFTSLKGWGEAMWDLWLHNGGSAPIAVTSVGVQEPCDAPLSPLGLTATGAKRAVSLKWGAVTGATSYNVYLVQGGKYALIGTSTTASFKHGGLTAGQTYCYVVTAVKSCSDTVKGESGYSSQACAVALR